MWNYVWSRKNLQYLANPTSGSVMGYQRSAADESVPREQQMLAMDGILADSHLFEVEQRVALLLELTDNKPHPIRLPFDAIFVDCMFYHQSVTYHGILLYEGYVDAGAREKGIVGTSWFGKDNPLRPDGNYVPKVFIVAVGESPASPGHINVHEVKCSLNDDYRDVPMEKEGEFTTEFEDDRNFLCRVASNVLDLVNDPDVTLKQLPPNPKRRERKWKKYNMEEPPTSRVILHPEITRYISQMPRLPGEAGGIPYRYIVRGHWREFRAERYTNMRGRRIWILPFTKGQGPLLRHIYSVEP